MEKFVMEPSDITIDCLQEVEEMRKLKDSWDELHRHSINPSIYNSHSFILSAVESFSYKGETNRLFTVIDQKNNKLLGVFFMSSRAYTWYLLKYNIFEYTGLEENDKPLPVIRKGYHEICWKAFLLHLKCHVKAWDHLQLREMVTGYAELDLLPKLCAELDLIYRARVDTQGPLVSLEGDWHDYWMNHKKMRKKRRKMQRDFGADLEFAVHQDDWEWCLDQYVLLEGKSWKQGKVGISKKPQTRKFYERLFQRLHAAGNLYFGFLTIQGKLISAEIAYTLNQQVYFCHGCYDQEYKKYSPGMVSTSFFLENFFDGKYLQGDFLCGFAGYMNDWASSTAHTYCVDIFQKRLKVRIMHFASKSKKKVFSFLKNQILFLKRKN